MFLRKVNFLFVQHLPPCALVLLVNHYILEPVLKNFDHLIVEVMRPLDNAQKESKYHNPHVSNLTFKKFSEGIALHILDGNPGSINNS